jgi:hypothetical protein
MKKLFENWREFRKKTLKESIEADSLGYQAQGYTLDKIKSSESLPSIISKKAKEVGSDALEAMKQATYKDIWDYAHETACSHWGTIKGSKCITPKHPLEYDAHKHILGFALYRRRYGLDVARAAGEWRERKGDSGKAMDLANNELGFAYGGEYNDHLTDKQIDRLVLDRIKKGLFYVRDGKTLFKDAAKEDRM